MAEEVRCDDEFGQALSVAGYDSDEKIIKYGIEACPDEEARFLLPVRAWFDHEPDYQMRETGQNVLKILDGEGTWHSCHSDRRRPFPMNPAKWQERFTEERE